MTAWHVMQSMRSLSFAALENIAISRTTAKHAIEPAMARLVDGRSESLKRAASFNLTPLRE